MRTNRQGKLVDVIGDIIVDSLSYDSEGTAEIANESFVGSKDFDTMLDRIKEVIIEHIKTMADL